MNRTYMYTRDSRTIPAKYTDTTADGSIAMARAAFGMGGETEEERI